MNEREEKIIELLTKYPEGLSQYKIKKELGFTPTLLLHNMRYKNLVDFTQQQIKRGAKIWFLAEKKHQEKLLKNITIKTKKR